MVRVEEPPEVTEVGLKLALAPAGRPEILKVTVWAVPEVVAVLMVLVPLFPWVKLTLEGLALIEKSLEAAVPQPGNLKEAIRVLQLKAPVLLRYSLVYQKVQSSTGSTVMAL